MKLPKKTCHREVFARITRAPTGKVISEGFCEILQRSNWRAGLELQRDFLLFNRPRQEADIILDFESLRQSEAMQDFLQFVSKREEGDERTIQICDGVRQFELGLMNLLTSETTVVSAFSSRIKLKKRVVHSPVSDPEISIIPRAVISP